MDSIQRAAKIRDALFVRGLTFTDIDRRYKLPAGSAYLAAHREPNAKGEAALAVALDFEAHEMWPERYDASGHRLEPQPHENYRRPPSRRQRRKDEAA